MKSNRIADTRVQIASFPAMTNSTKKCVGLCEAIKERCIVSSQAPLPKQTAFKADRFVPRNDLRDKKVRGSLRGNQRKMHCVKSGSIAEANCI
ncbi:MAG: hypothetical protein LC128_13480 [Chitinophagales bacterium]|nr:hypothetical protein [Chitinophagales bacterium]